MEYLERCNHKKMFINGRIRPRAAKEDDFLIPQKLTMAKEDTGTNFLTPQKLTPAKEDMGTDCLTSQKLTTANEDYQK